MGYLAEYVLSNYFTTLGLSMKVYLTDEFSLINISKNNDLAWDMIHIGQADVNIMECGKVKEVYVY